MPPAIVNTCRPPTDNDGSLKVSLAEMISIAPKIPTISNGSVTD